MNPTTAPYAAAAAVLLVFGTFLLLNRRPPVGPGVPRIAAKRPEGRRPVPALAPVPTPSQAPPATPPEPRAPVPVETPVAPEPPVIAAPPPEAVPKPVEPSPAPPAVARPEPEDPEEEDPRAPTAAARAEFAAVQIEGELEIRRKDAWRPVTARRYNATTPLRWREGESLKTGGGIARLTLSDGTRLSLNAGSEVRMDGAGPGTVRLEAGEVYAQVPKPAAGSPDARAAVRFLIRTDEAEARVTGTEFGVTRREKTTEVAVTEGTVTCAAAKGEVKLRAGQLASVKPAAAPGRPRAFDPKVRFAWVHAPTHH